MADLVRLIIDGVEYKVPKGMNLVDAAKMNGNDIPVFCYHPKMAPVGMCRMCLVELGQAQIDQNTKEFQRDEKGEIAIRWQPKLVASCTMTVTDGMAMRTNTEQVKVARDDIIEFILTSHPLDCPICDKGGECPLQNLTMRHGAGESRFVYDEKMHLAKHVPLGDLIYLDRERCIQCGRCVRYQEEVVGDPVLGFHERGRSLQIVTTSNPPFDTYFSGNTTDICPVGALTTADFRFGARPWELTEVPSICPHCPVGCNISASTRLDRDSGGKIIVKRIMPRQNEAVNEIWICDKGRFAHHHSRSADRITRPMIRESGKLVPTTWEKALARVADYVNAARGSVAAIAGSMLSNEDLWELRRLVENSGAKENALGVWPYRMTGANYVAQVGLTTGSNFKDMGKETTIVVVASDLAEEAPVWYLRIKQAADRGARLVVVNARATELDRYAKQQIRYTYGGEIAALQSVDVSKTQNLVVVVGGEGLDRKGHGELMQAAASILAPRENVGKPNNGLLAVWPGANTQGAFDLGYTSEATEAILGNLPRVVFLSDADVLGEDALSQNFANRGSFLVVSEMFMTATAQAADVVLPRQAFAERDGTFTSAERRVQRFYTAQAPLEGPRPDWKSLAEITRLGGGPKPKLSAQAVMQDITQNVASYAGMTYAALGRTEKQFPDVGGTDAYYGGNAYDNKGGVGIQWPSAAESGAVAAIAAPGVGGLKKLQSGELLIVPIAELYDRKPTTEASSSVIGSHIPAPYVVLNGADAQKMGILGGDTVTVRYAGFEVEVTARVDAGAPTGAALLARNLADRPAPCVPVVGAVRKVEVAAHV